MYCIPLSARDEASLREKLEELCQWLNSDECSERILDIAYTLGSGRDHYGNRIAFVVSGIEALKDEIEKYKKNEVSENAFYSGSTQGSRKSAGPEKELLKQALQRICKTEQKKETNADDVRLLASLYSAGLDVDFDQLYQGQDCYRISMPTYPYQKERYWIEKSVRIKEKNQSLHPLLDCNSSTMDVEKFRKRIYASEFFMKDHRVGKAFILPGVAYLEMAYAAATAAGINGSVAGFKDLCFLNPLKLERAGDSVECEIYLYPEHDDIVFEVISEQNKVSILHAQGKICIREVKPPAEKKIIPEVFEISGANCYEKLRGRGLNLGPSFQAIQGITSAGDAIWARLSLPKHLLPEFNQFYLHPSLVDGALETVIGLLSVNSESNSDLSMPFAIDEIRLYGKPDADCYSYAREAIESEDDTVRKYDVEIVSRQGNKVVELQGFSLKRGQYRSNEQTIQYYQPVWKEKDLVKQENNEIHPVTLPVADIPKSNCYIYYDQHCEDYSESVRELEKVTEQLKTIISERGKEAVSFNYVYRTDNMYGNAMAAYLRSIHLEFNQLNVKTIGVEDISASQQMIEEAISCCGEDIEVLYSGDKRYVRELQEIPEEQFGEKKSEVAEQGVYLVTGGAGGIGLKLVEQLVSEHDIQVILCGRSELSEEKKSRIRKLHQGKSKVVYLQCDITDRQSMDTLRDTVRRQYGEVRGIFHCAGVTKDCSFLKKESSEMQKVFAPKILGTMNLDETFAEDSLDFMVFFSSIASVTGNNAQCDYSFANRFMDQYALYRNVLQKHGKRQGTCISIDWSYWENGGIQLDEATKELFRNSFGIIPLDDTDGMQALNRCLNAHVGNVLVVKGNKKRIEKHFGIGEKKNKKSQTSKEDLEKIREYVHSGVTKVVCILLKMKQKDVSFSRNMSEYGFNSLTLTDFTNLLNQTFQISLTPAVFFECNSLEELAVYMIENYAEELQRNFVASEAEEQQQYKEEIEFIEEVSSSRMKRGRKRADVGCDMDEEDPIAVVGISGVMPDADNVEQYWKNLIEQRDCIRTIPRERWDWEELQKDPEQIISKWGGFMREINEFDAEFFGISPREARLMDPQQRIFMQTVWKTIEDAGYDAEELSGKDVGLFVGVATSDYSDVLRENDTKIEAYTSTGASHCILANRISYLFNWNGPSEPIDTACSSSLIAIHRAVSSIRNGDCSMAIAGGVNVITSPMLHIAFSKAGMLSADGRCKTFDERADGYVRGEGVGAIFLKKLSQAIKDHDHIYGIVKATAVNHGGHANSLTAPNPKAQANLIVKACEKADIKPDTIGYIEAHGTGTNLGDPAEINGLKAAFKQLYENQNMAMDRKNYCHISSVKTNIGHLEAAAGIASILKVLMALKYKMIPGNLHLQKLNPYIEIQNSPFSISANNQSWERLSAPRRAGVSSFGFGGANAHIILEEYIPKQTAHEKSSTATSLICISARNDEQREKYISDLYEFLKREDGIRMEDLSYTLVAGRKHMNSRFATYADSEAELCEILEAYLEHRNPDDDRVFIGTVSDDRKYSLEELKEKASHNQWRELAKCFAEGGNEEWRVLCENKNAYRISLPTYPFAKEKFWIPKTKKTQVTHQVLERLHPLLDQQLADGDTFLFRKCLKKTEFFVHDHVVNGQMLLPGVAYLEMARAAGEKAGLGRQLTLKDIVWIQPIILTQDSLEISILLEKADRRMKFTIGSEENGKRVSYCEGYLEKSSDSESPRVFQVPEIQKCCVQVLTKEECYQGLYREVGFDYGPTFQVTKQLRSNENEVITDLELPDALRESAGEFVLHPSLLDGAIRNIAGMGMQVHDSVHIPFALGRLIVFDAIPEHCYGYSTIVEETKQNENGTKRFHMSVLDEKGKEIVRIEDFTARPYRKPNHQMIYLVPEWKELQVEDYAAGDEWNVQNEPLVLLYGGNDEACQELTGIIQKKISSQNIVEWKGYGQGTQILERKYDSVYLLNLKYFEKHADGQELLETYLADQTMIYRELNKQFPGSRLKCFDLIGLHGEKDSPLLHSAIAFEKSFAAIDRKYEHQSIGIYVETGLSQAITDLMSGRVPKGRELVYAQGKVFEQFWKEAATEARDDEVIMQGGVYIITGGAGRIGMMFARKLAGSYQAKIVLSGRTACSDKIGREIERLRQAGAEAVYFDGDIANESDAKELIAFTKRTYGRIDGVFHCAGIMSRKGILEASSEEIHMVLNPKVVGTMNLQKALQGEKCKFLILFSSVSSLIGDFGGVSYAVANSYLDYLAGKSWENDKEAPLMLAINWPLWKKGKMQLPKEMEENYSEMTGFDAMEFDDAFRALVKCVSQRWHQTVVAVGERVKICHAFGVTAASKVQEHVKNTACVDEREVRTETRQYLRHLIAEIIGIEESKFRPELSFENYGIDSLMIMDLNKKLEKEFSDLRKTLFFEYSNLNELTDFFVENYESRLAELLDLKEKYEEEEPQIEEQTEMNDEKIEAEDGPDDIAIIGLNGKYPMAEDMNQFWENLKEGKDCITEIPKDRFEYEKYYSANKGEKNKIYCKWGGFMDDVDKFDPMFFKITPKDAQIIDPQERLFLEDVYGLLNDAGYTKESLEKNKVGVFVGVMYGHYQLYGANEQQKGRLVSLSSSYASIANRISYHFNFNGPSIALDTMCSSSLTAIHLACESILRNECEVAVAGGVNVTIAQDKYIFMCQQRFASSNGACRAFGIDGNGYVPGEGVGSVLLKPLKKAIRDHDNIYGVIKASAINHGGKTSGFSVPSPNAQSEVILEALEKAKINPRTISYVEAHGTGTELGDPIEITGLMKAYGKYTKDRQFCKIGSVKTNIGHAEAAAGIASLTKVLLQMKNKSYVPSLHSEVKNPNIDFEHTPFVVSQKTEEWKAPAIEENGVTKVYPRRAGISSFGAGGSNVHLIVEEYQNQKERIHQNSQNNLFVLSARNEKTLDRYVEEMCVYLTDVLYEKCNVTGQESNRDTEEIKNVLAELLNVDKQQLDVEEILKDTGLDIVGLAKLTDWIEEHYQNRINMGDLAEMSIAEIVEQFAENNCPLKLVKREKPIVEADDVAYTLQVGREEIDGVRLAFEAYDLEELLKKLQMYQDGKFPEGCWKGKLKKSELDLNHLDKMQEECDRAIAEKRIEEIAGYWIAGCKVEWFLLYSRVPYRISLPTYPFEKMRCWYEMEEPVNSTNTHNLHMIDSNDSTLDEISFTKHLSIRDDFLHDHVVKGEYMLPGVAFLEMAWEAALRAKKNVKVVRLKNIVWMKPIMLKAEDTLELKVSLKKGMNYINYEIYSGEDGRNNYNKGCIDYIDTDIALEKQTYEIQSIEKRCPNRIEASELYSVYENLGIRYGERMRGVQRILSNEEEVLAYVERREEEMDAKHITLLYSVMDAALQSLAGFSQNSGSTEQKLLLPFALEELEVRKELGAKSIVYARKIVNRKTNGDMYDIFILDEDGTVAVALYHFMGRYYQGDEQRVSILEQKEVLYRLQKGEITLEEAKQLLH